MTNPQYTPSEYDYEIGADRKKEILERYAVIINYFVDNPERAMITPNLLVLANMHNNDKLLEEDSSLKQKLLNKVLHPVINKRRGINSTQSDL